MGHRVGPPAGGSKVMRFRCVSGVLAKSSCYCLVGVLVLGVGFSSLKVSNSDIFMNNSNSSPVILFRIEYVGINVSYFCLLVR